MRLAAGGWRGWKVGRRRVRGGGDKLAVQRSKLVIGGEGGKKKRNQEVGTESGSPGDQLNSSVEEGGFSKASFPRIKAQPPPPPNKRFENSGGRGGTGGPTLQIMS